MTIFGTLHMWGWVDVYLLARGFTEEVHNDGSRLPI